MTSNGRREPAPGTVVNQFDVQVFPLLNGPGPPLGTSVTFTDVTGFRKLQNDLVVANRELETAYEELQSTNEELETTNEELQSTIEELETTNEELEGMNEELPIHQRGASRPSMKSCTSRRPS